jgi:5-methylcytosine-specific restriction protein A
VPDRLSARERGYSWRWEKVRAIWLKRNPICVMCYRDGRIEPATVVDHIVPHKGNQLLMWNEKNLQSLCAHHHNSEKKRQEMNTRPMIGADGWPM